MNQRKVVRRGVVLKRRAVNLAKPMNSDNGIAKTDNRNYRCEMRVLGESKLNPHTSSILEMRRAGKSISEIRNFLKKRGVSVAQSTVSDWLKNHPTQNSESQQNPPRERSIDSLGLFNDSDDFDRAAKLLRILWMPEQKWEDAEIQKNLGPEGFGIPLNRDDEPDYAAYAKQLGRRRVRTLGDMDYILFALWTKKIRNRQLWQANGSRLTTGHSLHVIRMAMGVRDEMRTAVGLPPPK